MKILKLASGCKPEVLEIADNLEAMQQIVGGSIQILYPYEDEVALVCHDEGKLLNLPFNRALRDPKTKEIYDIICGDCFLCGAPAESEHFVSLSKEQIKYYEEYYHQPEVFLQTSSGILIVKGV